MTEERGDPKGHTVTQTKKRHPRDPKRGGWLERIVNGDLHLKFFFS